jgi:hypothetical protein
VEFGGGLDLRNKPVESPQGHLQKSGEHDFAEQGGIDLVVATVLQDYLDRFVFLFII